MKLNEVQKPKQYPNSIANFSKWVKIRDSGEWNPRRLGRDLDCNRERLKSIEGSPVIVAGSFNCSFNLLETLKGAPRKVGNNFNCSDNLLTSLEYAPEYTNGMFFATRNKITNLKDIHKQIKSIGSTFWIDGNPIKSHVLGLLLIKSLISVVADTTSTFRMPAFDIINRHLEKDKDVLECQEELISSGFKEYAKL